MTDPLWVCGQIRDQQDWEFVGVYASRELAIAACRDSSYFVAPVQLNATAPDAATPWPGSFIPLVDPV